MGYNRLFLRDLTDRHLTWLTEVVRYAPNTTLEEWLTDIQKGALWLYDLEIGVIGIRWRQENVIVELIAGDGLIAHKDEIMDWLKREAEGRPIDMWTRRKGGEAIAGALGFRPYVIWMRF